MKTLKNRLGYALCILLVAVLFTSCDYIVIDRSETVEEMTKLVEMAYFEGQRDAIGGDIRIKLNPIDSTYVWIKSCHDDGTKPLYNPTYLDTKNGN